MTRRRFALILIAWLIAIALCATDLGAIVGFMAGMAVAMFGGALGVTLVSAASALGFDLSWSEAGAVLLYCTISLVALLACVTAVRGLRNFARGDERAALSAWAASIGCVAAPAALWLSVLSLQRTWP